MNKFLFILVIEEDAYSVMQSDGNSFYGDVVSDIFNDFNAL